MDLRVNVYRRCFFALAACMSLLSTSVKAEEALKRAYVLTESLNVDATKCNLNSELMQSHAEKALQANNIGVSHNEHEDVVTAYVIVTVVKEDENYCAANVSVQFYSTGYEELPSTEYVQSAKIVFCDKGTLLLGGADRMPARVADAVEQYTGECVTQISRKSVKRGAAG